MSEKVEKQMADLLKMADDLAQWTPEPIDMVNSPPHYKQGDIECIDAIKSALTEEEFRGYCKGNALKYTWRERHKGGDESLKKAQWYLDRLTGKPLNDAQVLT